MADSKISELTALTSPANDDVLAIVDTDAGVTKKITFSNLNAATSASVAADDISTGDAAVTIATSSGDITIDAPGDIILDAADNQIFFKDAGTTVGTLSMTGADLKFISNVSDKDIIFAGTDGGSEITALTLDMSAAGAATFNSSITATSLAINGGDITQTTGYVIKNTNGHLFLQSASAKDVIFRVDGGTEKMRLNSTGLGIGTTSPADKLHVVGDVRFTGQLKMFDNQLIKMGDGEDLAIYHDTTAGNVIKSNTSDMDILIQGNDGGSTITALTLDMSAAGAATFNSSITSAAGGTIGASGTTTTLAGIPFFSDTTNGSIYTHDVSGTDDTAQYNTAYGLTALDAITTGDMNTAIGYAAGGALNTGAGNVLIGRNSGLVMTSGDTNVAVGRDTLQSATDSDANIAIGYGALRDTTTGGQNLAVGYLALEENISGTRNLAVGFQALENPDTENDNVGIGYEALGGSIAGGEYNVAIGNYSLDALTSGDNNVALGYNAGSAATTAAGNVLIGAYVTQTGVFTGANNVVIGKLAGNDMTSADANVIIGEDAGANLTTADNSVLIGQGAGEALTTGADNIFIGQAAGDGHDAETNNLGIGTSALGGSVAGGEYNVAIGNNSLDALTSGDYNVAVGYGAGTDLTSGERNTFLGNDAGKDCIGGGQNVAIGDNAGGGALSTAAGRNIMIGRNAGTSLTSGTNSIFIGFEAGDGHDAEGNNLGIGTSALGGSIDGGEYNVAIGNNTLDALTSGDKNTGIGYQALTDVTTGGDNTTVGYNSLPNVLAGTDNVGLGLDAGSSITGGSANICIGSGSNVADADQDFGIAIGFEIAAAANDFSFGKTSNVVTNDFDADANWSRSSDERLKTNITNIDWKALDFINELRPVTFNWKASQDVSNTMVEHNPNKNLMNTTVTIDGLIAQEVKSAMDKHNINNFGGWKERQNNEDKEKTQTLSKEAFVMPLIKAVQELSAQVTTLQQEINTLKGE